MGFCNGQRVPYVKNAVNGEKLNIDNSSSNGAVSVSESRIQKVLDSVYEKYKNIDDGQVATYIPELGKAEKDAGRAVLFLLLANLASFVITAVCLFFLYRDMDARKQVEDKFKDTSKKLQVWVDDLEQRNSEFTVLNDTVDLLHTCVAADEAYDSIARSCQKLFPGMQGALYLIDEAKNLVKVATEWNGPVSGETVFQADDCWALRRIPDAVRLGGVKVISGYHWDTITASTR